MGRHKYAVPDNARGSMESSAMLAELREAKSCRS